ncbi:MAG: methyltransferase [Actinomycetota bacterium]
MSGQGPGPHYFDPDPSTASDPGSVSLVLPDLTLDLATDAGVFGRQRVDAGTKLLLLDGPAADPTARTLVDLGAGYGPITVALATRHPTAVVWAVEINARARELCQANADAAGLSNVRVVAPDEAPEDLVIDRLWSNPPIRIGKRALHQLLMTWLGRLGSDGTAHLVVQRHLGADSLQRWLSDNGWPTGRRSSKAGYRLLDVRRAHADRETP